MNTEPYNENETDKLKKILIKIRKETNKNGGLVFTKSSISYKLSDHLSIADVRFAEYIESILIDERYMSCMFNSSTGSMTYKWISSDVISKYLITALVAKARRQYLEKDRKKSAKYKDMLIAVLEETYIEMGESDDDMNQFLTNIKDKYKYVEVPELWKETFEGKKRALKEKVLDKLTENELILLKRIIKEY